MLAYIVIFSNDCENFQPSSLKNVTNVIGEQLKNYWSFIQDLSIKKNNIDFIKFSPASIAPTQGTDYSAGFDL